MKEAAKSLSQTDALRFRLAELADVNGLVRLINSAFRVELPYIEGDRIDAAGVRSYMTKGKFLVAEGPASLAGCVYVEVRRDRGYLGLLGVDPPRQGTGLGRKLMDAAEHYFREAGCRAIDLRVISARTPLPAFYRHLGYLETGTAPFSPDIPVKVPCHYILMTKTIG
ncbi:MAG TPA: GNAT family N-acetyltransferase [Candidatus Cybelea sp.]|nr:GNAT family N-acetyltransferase [Candidatus Cybelea sp.]